MLRLVGGLTGGGLGTEGTRCRARIHGYVVRADTGSWGGQRSRDEPASGRSWMRMRLPAGSRTAQSRMP